MLESVMEHLIAKYPSDFFPRKTLTLTGRQGSFSGVGRFDLLFRDEHDTTILMELKARPAKYEDASQLAKYYDVFKEQGKSNVLMWLVATAIPQSVREFLDRIGIEYTEIHESEYRNVAIKRGETIEVESSIFFETGTDMLTSLKTEPILNPIKINPGSYHNYKSKITPKYRNSLQQFGNIFLIGYNFLKYIIDNPNDGFWLSTSTNAHLYYKESFLTYLKLKNEGIHFSPYYNGRIESSTTDNHKLIFPKVFQDLTKDEEGNTKVWALWGSDGSVTIRKMAPAEFFSKFAEETKKAYNSQTEQNV